jgi:hypothetical protein
LAGLFLRLVPHNVGLLNEGFYSKEPDSYEQAGRRSPSDNSPSRGALSFELSLETPEFGKARRTGRQVQARWMIGRQTILCDVL